MSLSRLTILVFGITLALAVVTSCDSAIDEGRRHLFPIVIGNNPSSALKQDAFDLSAVSISNGVLRMSVVSGGGCRDHEYTLYMTPNAFMESYPVQANIYLRHDAKGDPCDAIVADSLRFDLTPVLDLYRQAYHRADTIFLNLYNFEQTQSERIILPPIR